MPQKSMENMKVPRPLLSCRSDYFANMKLIVIILLKQIRIFAPFLVTNTFRCVIGEFHHKFRFITISADIQSTTFKLRLKTQKKWQSNLKHTLLEFGTKFQSHISVVGPQSVLHKIIAVTYDSKFKHPKKSKENMEIPHTLICAYHNEILFF